MADIYESGGEGEGEAAVGRMDTKPDPKTGRTTRCSTSTPWWRKVLHMIAHGVAKYFGGDEAAKLTDKGIAKIQDETNKIDGHDLRKWFNEEPNAGIIVWGIAHAKGFVDDAWKRTEHDWPLRKAVMVSLGVTPESFSGSGEAQTNAALKVMLYSAAFGGIGWCYARHFTEALLLRRYATIAPLIPIIEKRGHDKSQRPKDKGSWATTAGPYVTETLALLEAAAVGLPLASQPPAAPPAIAGAGVELPVNIGSDTWVFSPDHGRWGWIECYAPMEDRPGRMLGLRFKDETCAAVHESRVVWR